MKKIITIILAVLMIFTAFASVSTTASTEIDVTNVATATTTNDADTSTTTTTQVVKNTQRIPLKKPKISKITVGKLDIGDTIYRVPKITFKKISNATRYRVAFKCPNKPNKWQYFTTKKIKY